MGGVVRIYNFLANFVILALFKYLPKLLPTSVLGAFVFWIINVAAAIMSNTPVAAFVSMLLLTSNVSLAIAAALILIGGNFIGHPLDDLLLLR